MEARVQDHDLENYLNIILEFSSKLVVISTGIIRKGSGTLDMQKTKKRNTL